MLKFFDRSRRRAVMVPNRAQALLGAAILVGMMVSFGSSSADQADAAADPLNVKVVVHKDNPTSSMSADQISKLFLKKVRTWPDWDVAVVPIDRGIKSQERKIFSEEIHDKSVTQINRYWQRQIFSGKDKPPATADSDVQVLAFVRANRGGIGYVAASTALGDGVKVLKVE